jgi:hypothetical protein
MASPQSHLRPQHPSAALGADASFVAHPIALSEAADNAKAIAGQMRASAQSGTVIGTGQMRAEVREQGAPMRSVSPFRPGIADSGANGRIQE